MKLFCLANTMVLKAFIKAKLVFCIVNSHLLAQSSLCACWSHYLEQEQSVLVGVRISNLTPCSLHYKLCRQLDCRMFFKNNLHSFQRIRREVNYPTSTFLKFSILSGFLRVVPLFLIVCKLQHWVHCFWAIICSDSDYKYVIAIPTVRC